MKTSNSVTILDYGNINFRSLYKALTYIGIEPRIAQNPKDLGNVQRVILPGVGSFRAAMQKIEHNGFDEAIFEINTRQIPVLGICLGMQLMFESSSEFGDTKGLGMFKGRIKRIPSSKASAGNNQKVPNVGWFELDMIRSQVGTTEALPVVAEDKFYFTHSFMAHDVPEGIEIAQIQGTSKIPAIVGCEQILGLQFHPEKSAHSGLKLLKYFARL